MRIDRERDRQQTDRHTETESQREREISGENVILSYIRLKI